MWKKDEESKPTANVTTVSGTVKPPKPTAKSTTPSGGLDPATIGRSITIKGDVTGDEDLYIQGRIDGTVNLKQHNVTVGPEGRVKANISGRTVTIEGEVNGDVRGQEQVALRASSTVNGDIVSPRVVLEDGATFLGSIDMSGNKPGISTGQATPAPSKPPKLDAEKTATGQGTATS
jgi:cytoskeletal protein CcmA (bactofilin family)